MELDRDQCYRALSARDRRFDGTFFVGVTSTGVYCRPVCTARTPRQDRCRFFRCAAQAEREGFRPCLKCRPELAPGSAPVDSGARLAWAAAARIRAGATEEGWALGALASEFGLSDRQVRRIVRSELGVSPVELAQTSRLLLAKQLLTETALSVTDVAFASGFGSLRRFNALFKERYGRAPSAWRAVGGRTDGEALRLSLDLRPPLAWEALLDFLERRAIPGVEAVRDGAYCRTVRVGRHRGWIRVERTAEQRLTVEVAPGLVPALAQVLARTRALFDMDARPDAVDSHLGGDPLLGPLVRRTPGLRVPGAWDGFELAWRAVLGQQVTVRAARTLAGRLAERLGEPLSCPWPGLERLSPRPEDVAALSEEELRALGLIGRRAATLRTLAGACAEGRLGLEPGADPEDVVPRLLALPGIGPWTAGYVAMRALRWPDGWPEGDVVLGRFQVPATALEAWRPWRAYAAMHLWGAGPGTGEGTCPK